MGHPVDPEERRHFLTGAPIDVAENVWIGAGATILPERQNWGLRMPDGAGRCAEPRSAGGMRR